MKLKFDFVKRAFLLLSLISLSSVAWSQRELKGSVTDGNSGEALIGATILGTGSDAGTVTDFDGNFSLSIPAGVVSLEVSYTGYETQTFVLTASNVVNVKMSAGKLLDEVVVVGYASVKKSDLTGSVSSVGEKDFNKGLMVTPDQLIQGKAAGVQVTSNSGQPGGATTVRIRGNSSIRAGSQPLYVVDGVQLSGASTKPNANTGDIGATAGSNPLNYLNPNDIESIQVLKDASATAIYGSRGSNGVVLITTKKGKKGAPTVDFNTSIGTSAILKKYDVLDAAGYRSALADYGLTTGDYGDNVDAMDEILRSGTVQNHGVSIGGGTDASNYRISLGYLDQEGIVVGNDLNRLSANVSGGFKFFDSKKVGVDFNLIASNTKENGAAVSTNSGFRGSLIGNALQWNPTHKLYNDDGTPVILPEFGNFTNPVALLDAYTDKTNTIDMIASISPYVKLTNNLTYKFNYSVTAGEGTRRGQIDRDINIQGVEGEGLAWFTEKNTTNQILTHTLNWDTEITSGVNMNLVGGYEYQKLQERGLDLSARGFIVSDFNYYNILQNSANTNRIVSSYNNPDAELQSYFAQGIFNINDRFLLTGTVRADGSSKFGENNRTGIFPSVAAAWNLHNEEFLSDGIFNSLKLRAGWGQVGNSEFPSGAAVDRFVFLGDGSQGVNQTNVGNKDLKWETTTNFGIGLDFAVMDYKLTGTVEYFNRNTTDILIQPTAIAPAPNVRLWQNVDANVINSGLELALNYNVLNNKDWNWDIGVNAAFLNNVVKNYDGAEFTYGQLFGQGISGATINIFRADQPLHAFITREHLEIGADGQSVYTLDEAGNEVQIDMGDPNPDMLLGISTSVSMGDLSLGLNFNGAYGHQIYNNTKNSVIPIGNLGSRNIDASLVGTGVQEATSNAIKGSSRYIEDGDYLKLANATLAYRLGDLGFAKNARVYISGNNLLVFTNYSGFDPEVNTVNELNGVPSYGVEYTPYPSARTFILGANFSF